MGRCQGGFCLPFITEILSRELNIPMEQLKQAVEVIKEAVK